MSGVWWPLGADFVCAAQSPRARIHAVELMSALRQTKDTRDAGGNVGAPWIRTACGLDAQLVGHTVWTDDEPSGVIIATWPAPVVDRCEDCATVTKVGRKMRLGSDHFQRLIPVEATGKA